MLKAHIINGFPLHTNQCPECIRPFFPYRDELTVYNGLILKGSHIVIPTELQDQLLNVIHESHLGICKTLEHARTSIFWPNITNDIKKLLSQCRACAQHQDKQPNESIISEPELKPWTSLSIDNFEYKGRHYLIILDRCTKFVVVKHVHSYDAGKTVETMCEVFSEFGLPENIHSDRGRNFLSNQFTQFPNTLGIDLTFCSAYHHSSNPAECAIRNVKNLMKCCASAGKSWHIALLEYLATPLSTGIPSPAAMMGRDFRGLLPHLQHFLPDSTEELLVHHMKTKSAVVVMICQIFLLEVMLHFWIIDQVNGIQQKCRIKNLVVTSLQLNKDIQFLIIMLTLDLLMYLFTCRLPE